MNRLPDRWIDRLSQPVDPDVFLAMTAVFQASAQRPLPTPKRKKPGYYLTDIPINRGMLGVVSALGKNGDTIAPESYLFRLMHLGEILEARELFGRFIRANTDGDGSVDVNPALLKAAAVARLVTPSAPDDKGPAYDLADVMAHAVRFDETAEDSATA